MNQPPLLLASSSAYRRQCLSSLGVPFESASPDVDETRLENESAEDLVRRLAENKARALRGCYPSHLIIGSDQVAVTGDGAILTKPGSEARAFEQLGQCRGARVRFLTGLCLLNGATGQAFVTVEPFGVLFRDLADEDLHRYLRAEQPFDCAGSFKMEGLGIVLFERLEGRDPNALIGLPLIALEDGLRSFGMSLLDYREQTAR